MLLTIRAVARRTRAKSANLDEFANALDARLGSLARVHNLLSQRETISIREILTEELSVHGAVEGENFAQHGPEVLLPAKQAQLLSMVLHELATNAVKHGALAVKNGHIDVMWDTDADRLSEHLRLRWRERGVMIERDPVKRGYGSELLERSMACWMGASIDLFIPTALSV